MKMVFPQALALAKHLGYYRRWRAGNGDREAREDESRTHRSLPRNLPQVLKTRTPTGAYLPS